MVQQRTEINIFRLQTCRFTDSQARSRASWGPERQMCPEQEVSGPRWGWCAAAGGSAGSIRLQMLGPSGLAGRSQEQEDV